VYRGTINSFRGRNLAQRFEACQTAGDSKDPGSGRSPAAPPTLTGLAAHPGGKTKGPGGCPGPWDGAL